MGRSLRAARVLQTARNNVGKSGWGGMVLQAPVWLKALERLPPAEILTRPNPIPHYDPNPRARKPRNIFKPQRIVHPEDELRQTFFKDHPWELARPRVAVELDGKDARYVDWSTGLQQPGTQVTGESVVQRQLWLMENGLPHYVTDPTTGQAVMNPETGKPEVEAVTPLSKEQAYDIARKEFYTIRQQEQITRRIAIEEARMVGGYFGKSRLEIGMELEDRMYDLWRNWAQKQVAKSEAARDSAYQSFGSETSVEAAERAELGMEAEAAESTLAAAAAAAEKPIRV